MTSAAKPTGKTMSVPGGMMLGGTVSLAVTVLSSAALAKLLSSERVSWDQSGYWIMGILFASAFLGAKAAIAAIKRQRVMISAMAGILYWGLLLCITALFFGGNYEAVLETAAVIIAGSGCAAMVSVPQKGKRRRKIKKR